MKSTTRAMAIVGAQGAAVDNNTLDWSSNCRPCLDCSLRLYGRLPQVSNVNINNFGLTALDTQCSTIYKHTYICTSVHTKFLGVKMLTMKMRDLITILCLCAFGICILLADIVGAFQSAKWQRADIVIALYALTRQQNINKRHN